MGSCPQLPDMGAGTNNEVLEENMRQKKERTLHKEAWDPRCPHHRASSSCPKSQTWFTWACQEELITKRKRCHLPELHVQRPLCTENFPYSQQLQGRQM